MTTDNRISRAGLLRLLAAIQNSAENANRDIMTFAGFCDSRDELADYVIGHFRNIAPVRQAEVFAAARALSNGEG